MTRVCFVRCYLLFTVAALAAGGSGNGYLGVAHALLPPSSGSLIKVAKHAAQTNPQLRKIERERRVEFASRVKDMAVPPDVAARVLEDQQAQNQNEPQQDGDYEYGANGYNKQYQQNGYPYYNNNYYGRNGYYSNAYRNRYDGQNGYNNNAAANYNRRYYGKYGSWSWNNYMTDEDFGFDITDYSFKYVGCSTVMTWSDYLAGAEDANEGAYNDYNDANDNGNYDANEAKKRQKDYAIDTVLMAQRFATFRLCPMSSCYSNSRYGCKGQNYGEYVVSLDQFVAAVLEFNENRVYSYCEYCQSCADKESFMMFYAEVNTLRQVAVTAAQSAYDAWYQNYQAEYESQYEEAYDQYNEAANNYYSAAEKYWQVVRAGNNGAGNKYYNNNGNGYNAAQQQYDNGNGNNQYNNGGNNYGNNQYNNDGENNAQYDNNAAGNNGQYNNNQYGNGNGNNNNQYGNGNGNAQYGNGNGNNNNAQYNNNNGNGYQQQNYNNYNNNYQQQQQQANAYQQNYGGQYNQNQQYSQNQQQQQQQQNGQYNNANYNNGQSANSNNNNQYGSGNDGNNQYQQQDANNYNQQQQYGNGDNGQYGANGNNNQGQANSASDSSNLYWFETNHNNYGGANKNWVTNQGFWNIQKNANYNQNQRNWENMESMKEKYQDYGLWYGKKILNGYFDGNGDFNEQWGYFNGYGEYVSLEDELYWDETLFGAMPERWDEEWFQNPDEVQGCDYTYAGSCFDQYDKCMEVLEDENWLYIQSQKYGEDFYRQRNRAQVADFVSCTQVDASSGNQYMQYKYAQQQDAEAAYYNQANGAGGYGYNNRYGGNGNGGNGQQQYQQASNNYQQNRQNNNGVYYNGKYYPSSSSSGGNNSQQYGNGANNAGGQYGQYSANGANGQYANNRQYSNGANGGNGQYGANGGNGQYGANGGNGQYRQYGANGGNGQYRQYGANGGNGQYRNNANGQYGNGAANGQYGNGAGNGQQYGRTYYSYNPNQGGMYQGQNGGYDYYCEEGDEECQQAGQYSSSQYMRQQNRGFYIGPTCQNNHDIKLAVYRDQYCSQLDEQFSVSDLLGWDPVEDDDGDLLPNECVACGADQRFIQWYENEEIDYDNYEEGVEPICSMLYQFAGKCNRNLNPSMTYNNLQYYYDENMDANGNINYDTEQEAAYWANAQAVQNGGWKLMYQSSEQEGNEQKVCSFIESLNSGTYNEAGDIVMETTFADWANPTKWNSQFQNETRFLGAGKKAALTITGLAVACMAAAAIFLHSRLARKNIPWRPRRNKGEDPTDLARQNSGIVMGRSRSGPASAPLL